MKTDIFTANKTQNNRSQNREGERNNEEHKKPDMKLRNQFRLLKLYIIICAVFLAALVLMGAFWGVDTMMIVGIVLMVIVIAFCWAFLKNMNLMVNRYLADQSMSILTLDDAGIELNKEGAQLIRLAWDNVAFVRVFQESVCFFAKGVRGLVIGVNRSREQEVLEYLSSNKINVRIIGR